MTREESWGAQGITFTLLKHITSLGYVVSVSRIPSSLSGAIGGFVEMSAVRAGEEPPVPQVSRVSDDVDDADYVCACQLAEAVGVELEDG